jgi:hypothetical protein
MKLAITTSALLMAGASAFTRQSPSLSSSTKLQETKADLEALAADLNPVVKYYDPFEVADNTLWNLDAEGTIGWYRHAEIKHGRVAMAAFVGYCVQSNFVLPYKLTLAGDSHPGLDLSPPEQWDALPFASKLQILLFVGFLEVYSELPILPHYTKGGKPGAYPPFDSVWHPVPLNLFDPIGLSKNRSEEAKAKGLKAEINNGRLAQLGIFGFMCESTIPGSVPLLGDIVKPYAGEYMAPF